MSVKYYHGGFGKLKVNSMVLPPSVTGVASCADYGAAKVCRRDRVYITTDLEVAGFAASFHPSGRGKVYEVFPIGELEPDPDCHIPGHSFQVEKARVCRIVPMNIVLQR